LKSLAHYVSLAWLEDVTPHLFEAVEMFLEKENQCHYEAKNLVGLGK